jgi:hypothetical protein
MEVKLDVHVPKENETDDGGESAEQNKGPCRHVFLLLVYFRYG